MSTTTTNYGLVKPELTDPADITAINPNWDKIDSELKSLNSATKDITPIIYGGTGASSVEQARSNLGIPETCITIEDWNTATKTGWYMGNNAANAPTVTSSGSTYWYFGWVIAHNSNYVFQEAYQFTSSSDAISIPKYIRACKEGVWGNWYDVTVQSKVPYDAKLDYIKNLTSDAQTQLDNKYSEQNKPTPADIGAARFASGSYSGLGTNAIVTSVSKLTENGRVINLPFEPKVIILDSKGTTMYTTFLMQGGSVKFTISNVGGYTTTYYVGYLSGSKLYVCCPSADTSVGGDVSGLTYNWTIFG